MPLWFYIILGWVLGSFCGAYVYRWPREISMLKPRRSQCPHCETTIPWHNNIPIFSFIFLRAKTQCCQKPIAWDYFWIEITSLVLFPIVLYPFQNAPVLIQLEWSIFFYFLLIQSFIDFRHRLIPDEISLGGTALGLAFSFAHTPADSFLALRALGAALGFLSFWSIAKAYTWYSKRDGLGMGDMKLIMMIGSFLTVWGVFYVIFLSSIIGLLIGVFLILLKKGSFKSAIPFGPCLAAAALILFLVQIYGFVSLPAAL
jgi:leader peptidase (prepilin peptidase) / N-methyltransferase